MPRRKFAVSFGQVVRFRRRHLGLAQEALADQAGIHRTTVSLIERGLRSPTVDIAQEIARALGTKLSVMVAEAEIRSKSRGRRSSP